MVYTSSITIFNSDLNETIFFSNVKNLNAKLHFQSTITLNYIFAIKKSFLCKRLKFWSIKRAVKISKKCWNKTSLSWPNFLLDPWQVRKDPNEYKWHFGQSKRWFKMRQAQYCIHAVVTILKSLKWGSIKHLWFTKKRQLHHYFFWNFLPTLTVSAIIFLVVIHQIKS